MADYTRVLDGGAKFIIIDQDNPDPLVPSFIVRFTNPTGLQVQHQILAIGSNATQPGDVFAKINGASATPTNTPLVAAGVGFAGGLGSSAANPATIVFDTAEQNDAEAYGLAVVEYNTTGTAGVTAMLFNDSQNINGVLRRRAGFILTINGTGVQFAPNVANIPAGADLRIRVWMQIR